MQEGNGKNKDVIVATLSDVPKTFSYLFGMAQAIIIILYFAFTDYDAHSSPSVSASKAAGAAEISSIYGMWQDIHVMIFVGFV